MTIKYDSNGNTVWQKRYDNGKNDYGRSITVDGSGNVYVTGSSSKTPSILSDYLTIKYDSNGETLWLKRYDYLDNDHGYCVTVDGSGCVYVTGDSFNPHSFPGAYDFLTIKYNAGGNQIWQKRYDGGDYDGGRGIAVDSSGNVYVAGYSDNASTWDYFTIKYRQY